MPIMQKPQSIRHTQNGAQLTELILEIFRLNGALLASGDALVLDLDLTSARWQVLGAIAFEGRPITVAQIGRRMGLSRQAVQRVANDLQSDGLVTFEDNPDHKRAKLVALTKKGRDAYGKADIRQIKWANALGKGLDPQALAESVNLLRTVHERCRNAADGDR